MAVFVALAIAVRRTLTVVVPVAADLAVRRFARFVWRRRDDALLFGHTAAENPFGRHPTGINAHPAFLGDNLLEMLDGI